MSEENARKIEEWMPKGAAEVVSALTAAGYEAAVVGGCVRDAMLGRAPSDWDITTNARPEEVKAVFRRTVDTGIAHGTVSVLTKDGQYEVTTYRVDGDYPDHRHPEEVSFTSSLKEDLKRRDFTINAMCYTPEKGLIDLFGGQEDLRKGVIRAVGVPAERFAEDALRILRALRFSAQLDFTLEEETCRAVCEGAPTLRAISAERIREELIKLITSAHPERFTDVVETGVCAVILPEYLPCMETEQHNPYHNRTVGMHMIDSMCHVRRDPVLRLTMLLHDIAKPQCLVTDENGVDHFYGHPAKSAEMAEEILRRLKCDNKTIASVTNLIRHHDIFVSGGITAKSVRRAANKVGAEFPLLLEVMAADDMAKSDYRRAEQREELEKAKRLYEETQSRGEALQIRDLAVNGSDLIAAGVPEGVAIGKTLRAMLEDVLEEPAHNTREYLMERFV